MHGRVAQRGTIHDFKVMAVEVGATVFLHPLPFCFVRFCSFCLLEWEHCSWYVQDEPFFFALFSFLLACMFCEHVRLSTLGH